MSKATFDESILPHGPNFKEAWELWLLDRRERRKPITTAAQRIQLKKLGSVPEEEAIKMIEQSINKGWIGIFPLDERDKNTKPAIYL